MKKTIVACLLAVAFISCKKENKSEGFRIVNEKVVGKTNLSLQQSEIDSVVAQYGFVRDTIQKPVNLKSLTLQEFKDLMNEQKLYINTPLKLNVSNNKLKTQDIRNGSTDNGLYVANIPDYQNFDVTFDFLGFKSQKIANLFHFTGYMPGSNALPLINWSDWTYTGVQPTAGYYSWKWTYSYLLPGSSVDFTMQGSLVETLMVLDQVFKAPFNSSQVRVVKFGTGSVHAYAVIN